MKVQKHFIYAAIHFLVDDIVSLQYLHMLDMLAVYVTVINYYKENEALKNKQAYNLIVLVSFLE